MQAAVRPRLAAGVALVGASVIAASTITPVPDVHLADLHLPTISTIDVSLAAAANPLELYAKVFADTLSNANTLLQNTVPGQVLQQIIANQLDSAAALGQALSTTGGNLANAASQVPAALVAAVGQLAAGDVSGAVNTLLGIPLSVALPATDILPTLGAALVKPLENLVKVINAFTTSPLDTLLAVSGFIAPLISVPAAAAAAVQNVLNAVGTGDLSAVANAIVAAPATVLDGLLNGGYGPDLGPLVTPGLVVKAGGLLSSAGLVFSEDGSFYVNTGGPLFSLQQVLQKIATALAPPAPLPVATAAIAAIPSATAVTVGLATAPTSAARPAAEPGAEVAPVKDAPTSEAPSAEDASAAAEVPATTAPADIKPTETSPVAAEPATTVPKPTETVTAQPTTQPVKAQPVKPATGVDVTTGNKVEPHTSTGPGAESGTTGTKGSAEATGTASEDATGGTKDSSPSGATSASSPKGGDAH